MDPGDPPESPAPRLGVDELLRAQVRARIRRLVADPEDVEDLTQETMLRVLRGLPGYRAESSLRTWALRIAGHVVVDGRRRAACRPVAGTGAEADELPAVERSPDEQADRAASADCFRRVLAALPEAHRVVFELHDLAGFDNAEIARLFEVPVSTVKIRLHRARRRLRAACEAGCEVERDEGGVTCCPRDEPSR